MFQKTIQTIIAFVFILMCGMATASYAQTTPAKLPIGVVDMSRVMSQSNPAKELKKQIDARAKSIQANVKSQRNTFASQQQDILKQKPTLSQEEFASKAKAFDEKIAKASKTADENAMAFEKSVRVATNELEKRIGNIVAEIANKKGFLVVLSREGTVLADKSLDITDEVIEQTNAKVSTVSLK
jgi:outer membrane protein